MANNSVSEEPISGAVWVQWLVELARCTTTDGAVEVAAAAVRASLGFERADLVPLSSEQPGRSNGTSVRVPVAGSVWGSFVVGSDDPSEAAVSAPINENVLAMLETAAAMIGVVIEREANQEHQRESSRRLEAYAYEAAHDLRSPLRRIRSFSQILQARLSAEVIDRDQVSDFAERVANGAERLDDLIGSILEHTTIETLAVETSDEVDLQLLVQGICDGVVELSQEPLPVFLVEDLPTVRLPNHFAQRILSNLIEDALMMVPSGVGARIEISGETNDDGLRLSVRSPEASFTVDLLRSVLGSDQVTQP